MFLISLLGFQISATPVANAPGPKQVPGAEQSPEQKQPTIPVQVTSPAQTTIPKREDTQKDTSQTNQDLFAKCLTDSGAVFYGSSTCGHCKNQKALFGDAFKYINYVECNPRAENSSPQTCTAADIKYFPTWIIGGKKIVGTQSLDKLAEKTNCKILPEQSDETPAQLQ